MSLLTRELVQSSNELRLLFGGTRRIGQWEAVLNEVWEGEHGNTDHRGDTQHLDKPIALGVVDVLVPPLGEAFIGIVKDRTNQPSHTPHNDEHQQLPHGITRFSLLKDKVPKGKQFIETDLAETHPDGVPDEQRGDGPTGTIKCTKGERLAPVTRPLLKGKEESTNGGTKGRTNTRRGTTGDVIPPRLIVLHPRGRNGSGHDGTGVYHRPLLTYGQAGGDAANDAEDLTDASFEVVDSGQVDAVEEAFDLGYSGAAGHWFDHDGHGCPGCEEQLADVEAGEGLGEVVSVDDVTCDGVEFGL